LSELRAELDRVDGLKGLERARAARELAQVAARVVAAAADEAIYEATRTASYEAVARELGVSYANVNRACTRHRRALQG